MSREQQDPSETAGQDGKTSRRDLLKRALIVLGAGAIVQAAGGVRTAFGQETPKKEETDKYSKIKQASTTGTDKGKKKKGKGKSGHKGSSTVTPDTPKKEGSSPVF